MRCSRCWLVSLSLSLSLTLTLCLFPFLAALVCRITRIVFHSAILVCFFLLHLQTARQYRRYHAFHPFRAELSRRPVLACPVARRDSLNRGPISEMVWSLVSSSLVSRRTCSSRSSARFFCRFTWCTKSNLADASCCRSTSSEATCDRSWCSSSLDVLAASSAARVWSNACLLTASSSPRRRSASSAQLATFRFSPSHCSVLRCSLNCRSSTTDLCSSASLPCFCTVRIMSCIWSLTDPSSVSTAALLWVAMFRRNSQSDSVCSCFNLAAVMASSPRCRSEEIARFVVSLCCTQQRHGWTSLQIDDR